MYIHKIAVFIYVITHALCANGFIHFINYCPKEDKRLFNHLLSLCDVSIRMYTARGVIDE